MSFGESETCEYCGGDIVEKQVTLHRKAITGKEYPGLRRIFGHLRGAEMGA
ncbi:MAG: hypothetical protein GY797_29010 [Deltaproteobacteria bacterium]|nr:hypothetical protein [Deltaproteobacteria bacterium]